MCMERMQEESGYFGWSEYRVNINQNLDHINEFSTFT